MALIIVIENVSNLAEVSDYTYRVLVGDGSPNRTRTLSTGRVDRHRRDDGWLPLAQRVIEAEQERA